jgi:hypothetical protein
VTNDARLNNAEVGMRTKLTSLLILLIICFFASTLMAASKKVKKEKTVQLSPLEQGTVTAVRNCDVAAVSTLFSKGVSPDLKINAKGDDLYSQLPSMGFFDNCRDTLALLVKSGANLKHRNSNGITAEYRFGTAFNLSNNILILMSQYGADFKSTIKCPKDGWTSACVDDSSVLMSLAGDGMVNLFIGRGPNFDQTTLEHLDFIEANSDINATNAKGQTALHIATASGNINNITYLLKHGADPAIKDKNGMTASDIAFASGNSSLMRLFTR